MNFIKRFFNKKSPPEPIIDNKPIINDTPIINDVKIDDSPQRSIVWEAHEYEHKAVLTSEDKFLKLIISEYPDKCTIFISDFLGETIDFTKTYFTTIEEAKKIANSLAESVANTKIVGWNSAVKDQRGIDSFDKVRILIFKVHEEYALLMTSIDRLEDYKKRFASLEEAGEHVENLLLKGLI